jgi:hypothetical protein
MKARRFDRLKRLRLRRSVACDECRHQDEDAPGSGSLSRSGVRHALAVMVRCPLRVSQVLRAHGVALTGWSVLHAGGLAG